MLVATVSHYCLQALRCVVYSAQQLSVFLRIQVASLRYSAPITGTDHARIICVFYGGRQP